MYRFYAARSVANSGVDNSDSMSSISSGFVIFANNFELVSFLGFLTEPILGFASRFSLASWSLSIFGVNSWASLKNEV